MPYIKDGYRPSLDEHIDPLIRQLKDQGEYNKTPKATYVVYKFLKGVFGKDPAHWFEKAQAYTVLTAVEHEYDENVIRPHEKKAKERNGDIL